MPRKATTRKAKSSPRRTWTAADTKLLRQSAKAGVSGARIAKQLKRTPGAIYQQASTLGIKLLGNRRRAKAKKRA